MKSSHLNSSIHQASGHTCNIDATSFARAGGCSCKLNANVLHKMVGSDRLAHVRGVGHTNDDAAIIRIPGGQFLLTSVDFQTPALADWTMSGKVAGFNALSDLFACGVQPHSMDVVLAVPDISPEDQALVGRQLMDGIAEACAECGCTITGGHTLVLPTPLVGGAVRGFAEAEHVKRKGGSHPGDILLLTKSLGLGIAVAAHQSGRFSPTNWATALAVILQPNTVGAALGRVSGITSMTDVTGFGFLGHALEMAEQGRVSFSFDYDTLPVLDGALRAAANGAVPTLAKANSSFVGDALRLEGDFSQSELDVLFDPQTNGGLLLTCAPESVEEIRAICNAYNQSASIVGLVDAAASGPRLTVFRGG